MKSYLTEITGLNLDKDETEWLETYWIKNSRRFLLSSLIVDIRACSIYFYRDQTN